MEIRNRKRRLSSSLLIAASIFFGLIGMGIAAGSNNKAVQVENAGTVKQAASVGRASQTQQTAEQTAPAPVVKTETKAGDIPYESITQKDPGLPAGETKTITEGVMGTRTITYKVTYTGNVETNREKVSETVTKQPVNKVTHVGTKVAQAPAPAPAPAPVAATPQQSSNCDPNYSGACVPIAYDVDCAGGSGNGPAYVKGPVKVIGVDIYKLDADHDGIGCE